MEHVIWKKVVGAILRGNESDLYEGIVKLGSYLSSKYGIQINVMISVIVGSVCMYIFLKRRFGKSKGKRHFLGRSRSLAELHGGERALERLFDYNEGCVVPASLDHAEHVLEALLQEEHFDLKKLQSTVAKLEMTEKEGTAIKILKNGKKKHAGKPHHIYEIEMLLVEMLIYKGDYEEALACECLKHEEIADVRRPLYKAVIYTIQRKMEDAEKCWEEFSEIRTEFIETRNLTYEQQDNIQISKDFKVFQERVNHLHQKILSSKAAKSKKSSQK